MPKYMYILYMEEFLEDYVLLEDPIPFSSWKDIHEFVKSFPEDSILKKLLEFNEVPLAKYEIESDYREITVTVIRKLINPVPVKKSSLVEYLCSFTKEFPVWKEAEKEVDRLFPGQEYYTTEDLEYLMEGD